MTTITLTLIAHTKDAERIERELNYLNLGVYSLGVSTRPATEKELAEVRAQVPEEEL